MTESSVSVCPVPAEQQPLNEYEELKTSWLFSYCILDWSQYIQKLVWVWCVSWFVVGPVAAASFAPSKYAVQFTLCGTAGASVAVALTLVRIYLGWSYVRNRLVSPTIFYEESGWYDGQTWTKPAAVLTRDRLIVTYQIQPVFQRLQQTFAFLAVLLVIDGLLWFVLAASSK